MNIDDKQSELKRTRDILVATLDYLIGGLNKSGHKNDDFNSTDHFNDLKKQTDELYKKGRLSKLKSWLRYMTEIPRETGDLNFTTYIKQQTGYDFDIFIAYNKRIENIITKGKITTENQFREVNSMVDFLCNSKPTDDKKIETLNNLLLDFEHHLNRKKGKPKLFKKLDNYYSKNVLELISPDQTKSLTVFENGETKEKAITQMMIKFAQGGGGIFAAYGTDLNLKITWTDNSTLSIGLPKGIDIFKQETRTQFYKDFVLIKYHEQT